MKWPSGTSCDVSVIIPTYNRKEFLQEAVQSVLQQSLPPRELIIVDDGSTDGSREWLQGLSSKNIQVLFQENQGPALARNAGVSRARGSLIAFLDSDDLWLPQKLEVQWSFMEANPAYKVCQTEEIWIRHGIRVNPRKKHSKPSGRIFAQCLKLCLISPSAVMMDKAFFEGMDGFDPEFPVCEDYELWLRVSLATPVCTLSQALTVKRGGHADQLSKKYWGMDRFRVKAMEKLLARQRLDSRQKEILLQELRCKLSILAMGFSKRHPGQPNLYQDKLLWWQKNLFKEAVEGKTIS